MIEIFLSGESITLSEGSKVSDLIAYAKESFICGALVGNVVKSLNYTLEDGDTVKLISIKDEAGYRIYESTLLLILGYASNDVFPGRELMYCHSIGGGIYCEFTDGKPITESALGRLGQRMEQAIRSDYPISKVNVSLDRARELLSATGSLRLIEYASSETLNLFEMDGYFGHYQSKTLLNSGAISAFSLVPYPPGFVVMCADRSNPAQPRKIVWQDNIQSELLAYEKWCERLGVSNVASLNKKIESGEITHLITVAEARHEQLISKMADEIYKGKDKKRVILISGPSCSGKTTTSKRLRSHLIALGLNPIAISLDDYFVNRDRTPLDEDGKPDYESIHALDIETFNSNLISLMAGEKANIPRYSFITGMREAESMPLALDSGSPIIIEGIHGLNEMLTADVPKENKYKIYINDFNHINMDESNRVSTSDTRLFRRIVRDRAQRGYDALATIAIWQSVRRGEELNIYPYSSEADFVFNSSLLYEMSVLKKYAEPALSEIGKDSEYYHEASRLLEYLSYFLSIEDESAIYSSSILREFIGGNVFERL
ncbi:MAG: nucleoside kinase [Eubacteriaceae bacterium]|nr:nucleoside kinase [Eubacteriaceae bacterium]